MNTMNNYKAKVIAVMNQKGGVGKTTTVMNLGVGLARLGFRVLLIDADPQGSLTVSLGVKNHEELPVTLASIMNTVMDGSLTVPTYGIVHHKERVDYVPANRSLSGTANALKTAENREYILKTYVDSCVRCAEPLKFATRRKRKPLHVVTANRQGRCCKQYTGAK